MKRSDKMKVAVITTTLFIGMILIIAIPLHLLISTYITSIYSTLLISFIISFFIFPLDRFINIFREIGDCELPV